MVDPVVLLTNRVPLPVRPMSPIHLAVIVDAVLEAWAYMLANWSTLVGNGIEAKVNAALVTRLQATLTETSPFSSLVYTVLRGSEHYNYNGEHYEKRPDLNFYFKRRDHRFPLVGECKIVDASNSQTVGKYNRNGIERFVIGDYGWFGSQGLMVAYVRDGTDVEGALTRVAGSPPKRWPSKDGPHFQTSHDRMFRYLDRPPGESVPGAISLIHVWLCGSPGVVDEPPGT